MLHRTHVLEGACRDVTLTTASLGHFSQSHRSSNLPAQSSRQLQRPHILVNLSRLMKSTPQPHCSHRVLVVPPSCVDGLENNPWELLRGLGQLLHLLIQLPAGQNQAETVLQGAN